MAFERDPNHWLRKFSPDEWVQAALAEVRRAEGRFKVNDFGAALAGCKRAAGMALNGALLVEPNDTWGRTYVEHLSALARDPGVPEQVRTSSRHLVEAKPPGSDILTLRTQRTDERVLDATRDVMAHAYAVIKRHDHETA